MSEVRTSLPPYNRRQKDLFGIIGKRHSLILRMQRPHIVNWQQMTEGEYHSIVAFCERVREETASVGNGNHDHLELNADKHFSPHIDLMVAAHKKLWEYGDFRTLLPPNSSIYLAFAIDQLHDFSRNGYNNGNSVPMWIVDYASERLVQKVFPSMPDLAHHMQWMLGVEDQPSPSAFALTEKALDTFCKPHVDPHEYFSPGGAHDQWFVKHKNQFPMMVPAGKGRYREVSLEDYKAADRHYTQMGIGIIENVIGSGAFPAFIQEVQNELRPH